MEYKDFREISIIDSNERIEEIDKLRTKLLQELEDIENGFNNNLSEEEIEDRKFKLLEQITTLSYELSSQVSKRRIANLNLGNAFLKKSQINSTIKRFEANNTTIDVINSIMSNPLVNGQFNNIFNDMTDIRCLIEFVNMIENNEGNNLDSDTKNIFQQVNEIVNVYRKIMSSIQINLDTQLSDIQKLINNDLISNMDMFNRFKEGLNGKVYRNRLKGNIEDNSNNLAQGHFDNMKLASQIGDLLQNPPLGIQISANILSDSIPIVKVIDIITQINKILNQIVHNLPQTKDYGGYQIDYAQLIETVKKVQNEIDRIKGRFENKLNSNGFNKEMSKIEEHERNEQVINLLSKEFEKMGPNIGGTFRQELENNIESILMSYNIPKEQWDRLKSEAQKLAKSSQEIEKERVSSKFKEANSRENREIAIANAEFLSQEELDEIRREAETEANARYPENYVNTNGEGYDLNGGERGRFIQKYIEQRVQSLAGMRFDNKEREQKVNEELSVRNNDQIISNGLSEDMLSLAAEILKRNNQISSEDLTKLNPSEISSVIKYTTDKLKNFAGLSEIEIATTMAKDPFIDENGKIQQREGNQADIITQLNLNRMHNIAGRIENLFQEQGIKK